jgi:general secretion pathway protein G
MKKEHVMSTARRIVRNAQRGLTLLEIMIVIAILGILIAVVAPKVIGALSESKVELTKVRVNNIKNWYQKWSLKSEKPCPDSLLDVVRSVSKGDSEEQMVDNTKDLWHQPLKFMCGDNLPNGVQGGLAVYSVGANGKDEHDAACANPDQCPSDDIVSWK